MESVRVFCGDAAPVWACPIRKPTIATAARTGTAQAKNLRLEVRIAQPELSNEPPPLVEVELPPPPPDEEGLGACRGAVGAEENDGVGSGAGAGATEVGARDAATDAGDLGVEGAAASAGGAGAGRRAGDTMSIGRASLRRTGMAALIEATGRVDGSSLRAALPVLVARPTTKKHADTTHRSAITTGTRGSTRGGAGGIPSLSVSMSMRAVFTRTDTSSA